MVCSTGAPVNRIVIPTGIAVAKQPWKTDICNEKYLVLLAGLDRLSCETKHKLVTSSFVIRMHKASGSRKVPSMRLKFCSDVNRNPSCRVTKHRPRVGDVAKSFSYYRIVGESAWIVDFAAFVHCHPNIGYWLYRLPKWYSSRPSAAFSRAVTVLGATYESWSSRGTVTPKLEE
jgi:hypothetical protein